MQYDRSSRAVSAIVNPGSVGMPYEGRSGAYWALLGPDVELRRTEYDVEAAWPRSRYSVRRWTTSSCAICSSRRIRVATTEYFESLRAA